MNRKMMVCAIALVALVVCSLTVRNQKAEVVGLSVPHKADLPGKVYPTDVNPTVLQEKVRELQKSLQAAAVNVEEARQKIERQSQLLEQIDLIEKDFDKTELSVEEYLQKRRVIARELLADIKKY